MNKIRFFSFLLICLFILVTSYRYPPVGDVFSRDLFEVEGVLMKHVLSFTSDSLSGNEILELQDTDGLTIWFARFFYKDICVTGLCNIAKFWIFWDGAGNYHTFRLNNNEPLTKANHIEFLDHDYIKLNEILCDTASILRDLRYEDIAIDVKEDERVKESFIFQVDSYTGATLPSISQYVVEDAVFTCYTLWHTVYGETKERIQDILENRVDSNYIEKLFNGDSTHKNFALELIKERDILFIEFESQVLQMVNTENYYLSKKAISCIPKDYLMNPKNQIQFIELMDGALTETKLEIIYKLQLLDNVPTNAILLLLDKHTTGIINVGGLNQVFKIITKQIDKKNISYEKIRDKIDELSKSTNPETSNLSKNFLRSIR